MATQSIEVNLPMEQVIESLQIIHADFLDQQRRQLEADAPLVSCREIQEQIPHSFVFSGDWKHPGANGQNLKEIWTLDIKAVGSKTRIYLQMANEQPVEYQISFRMFTALVKAWAIETH